MKILSVDNQVSGVADDDYDCSITGIVHGFSAIYKDSFYSRACVCGNRVAHGYYLRGDEMTSEYSIMNDGMFFTNEHCYRYYSERLYGTVRHEIFFGTANRKKSIKYGLVVFIMPEDHNMSEYGVHCMKGNEFDMYLKKLGQERAMKKYAWTTSEFIDIFGKNYL